MKIGLVDVDSHARKKKWGATIYPNLALAKIARYHIERGDEVEWVFGFEHYDRIYMSKIFNFSPDDTTCYDADEIVKGGTGYDIYSKLPDEIDRLQPYYDIYPNLPKDTAYGFLTRGCPNKCKWCVVPRKEGKIVPYMDVDEIAIEGRKKLVLMDNNILAAGDYCTEQLQKIIERGYRIDFNQAMDARLVNEDNAKLLAQVRWIDGRIRFGCDTHPQIKDCERAMALINANGFRGHYFLYTMLNENFDECYDRIHYWWVRHHETREQHLPNIYPYAQPYRNPDKPNTPPNVAERHGLLGQQTPDILDDRLQGLRATQGIQMQRIPMNPRKEYHKQYYLANKERIKARMKAYYQARRDTMSEEDKEKEREYRRLYRIAHLEKYNEYHKNYYKRKNEVHKR